LELEISQASVDNDDENASDAHDELLQGLVDVRGRLERLGKGKSKADARTKLVETIATSNPTSTDTPITDGDVASSSFIPSSSKGTSVADMDRRVGQLEELVGSSSASLDEVG
jgi:nuclear migration protein JNM1